eukprot:1174537-Pleurochrysis_carterae.AAC.1
MATNNRYLLSPRLLEMVKEYRAQLRAEAQGGRRLFEQPAGVAGSIKVSSTRQDEVASSSRLGPAASGCR